MHYLSLVLISELYGYMTVIQFVDYESCLQILVLLQGA